MSDFTDRQTPQPTMCDYTDRQTPQPTMGDFTDRQTDQPTMSDLTSKPTISDLTSKPTMSGLNVNVRLQDGASNARFNLPPTPKKPSYYQRYRPQWENDPRFKGWLMPFPGDTTKARCRICGNTLRAHMKSIGGHAQGKKHLDNMVLYGGGIPPPYNTDLEFQRFNRSFRMEQEGMDDGEDDFQEPIVQIKDELNITGNMLDDFENSSSSFGSGQLIPTTVGGKKFDLHKGSSKMINVAILTVSDRCNAGEAVDESGPNLQALISSGQLFQGTVLRCDCVPDEGELIKDKLLQWCKGDIDLIITTGGTGFTPRDVTPEAVKEVIEKEAPALTIHMITQSLKVTPLAMLSRPVCGIRGQTLIVTLPGSKKGSEECLRFIAPSLSHAIDLLVGRGKRVENTHSELQNIGVVHSIFGHSQDLGHLGHQYNKQNDHNNSHDPNNSNDANDYNVANGSPDPHNSPAPPPRERRISKVDVSYVCRRPRQSPYPMISVVQATDIVMSRAWQCITKTVKMKEALGYVLAQDIQAKDPLPPFPASIKDGYAIIASDGAGLRRVKGSSTAGCKPEECVITSGECVRINTGAPIPPGADAVIQVEDSELIKEADDGRIELEVSLLKTPYIGQDIRPMGCDIATGQTILTTGTLLGPSEVGLLATVGVTEVMVVCKPTVAVLSTGNELQEPTEPLKVGHIRDSNKTTLISLLKQHNFPVIDAGIAIDEPTDLLNVLESAFSRADVVVTSGGVSMGERDILRPVLLTDFQAEIHFAQVFMKPGKPTTFATCNYNGQNKLILGLPGNPVSAVVTSNLYLLPLCRKMSGRTNYMYTCIRAKLSAPIHLDARPEYHRVTLCWEPGCDIPIAYSTGNQISSRLLSLAYAQALLRLPHRTEEMTMLPANCVVDALVLNL